MDVARGSRLTDLQVGEPNLYAWRGVLGRSVRAVRSCTIRSFNESRSSALWAA